MKALVKLAVGEGKVSIKDVEEPQVTRDDEVKFRLELQVFVGRILKFFTEKMLFSVLL